MVCNQLICECCYITESIEELNEHKKKCAEFQSGQSKNGRERLIRMLGSKLKKEDE